MGTILFTSISSVRPCGPRRRPLEGGAQDRSGILVGAALGAQIAGALSTFWWR